MPYNSFASISRFFIDEKSKFDYLILPLVEATERKFIDYVAFYPGSHLYSTGPIQGKAVHGSGWTEP